MYNVPDVVVGTNSVATDRCNRASMVGYSISYIYTTYRNFCGVYNCDNIKNSI